MSVSLSASPSTRVVDDHVPARNLPGEVSVLRWPAQDEVRRWLAERHQPRILVVDDDAAAPEPIDDLEDWVRGSLGPVDRDARARALLRRTAVWLNDAPYLDEDGLLRNGDQWVMIPEGQLPIVDLLLARLNRLVPSDELRAAYVLGGGSGHENSIRTVITRLAKRVRSVGLELVTIRGRGLVLAVSPESRRD